MTYDGQPVIPGLTEAEVSAFIDTILEDRRAIQVASLGEEVIVCTAHKRRCYRAATEGGAPVRMWHEGVSGDDLCSSQRFRIRYESEQSLAQVLAGPRLGPTGAAHDAER